MNLSHSNSIRYGLVNVLTGLFLTDENTWTANVFEAELVTSRDKVTKRQTSARKTFADEIEPSAIEQVRVRADVRRAQLGRPRKVA